MNSVHSFDLEVVSGEFYLLRYMCILFFYSLLLHSVIYFCFYFQNEIRRYIIWFWTFICYTGPQGWAILSRTYGLFPVYVLWLCIGTSLWVTSMSLDTVWALKLGIFILAHDSVIWILGIHEFASRNDNVNYAFLHLISATFSPR